MTDAARRLAYGRFDPWLLGRGKIAARQYRPRTDMPLPVSFTPHRGSGAAVLLACISSLIAGAAFAASTDFDAERKRCEAEQQSVKVVCLRELKAAMAAGGSAASTAAPTSAPAATTAAPSASASGGKGAAPAGAANKAATVVPSSSGLYKVVGGDKVDPGTLEGFRTWRAAACSRCHGANQEGLVGPSLINSLKTLSKQDFVTTVTNGRLEKGMPSFKGSQAVMDNIDHLYAYLKGRSDGAITAAHVYPMK
jgi:mono/diheme cytochrome c family protein